MLFIPTLDWQDNYRKDRSGLYQAIISLPEQIASTCEEICELKLPVSYKQVNKIVLLGMGGSALGARAANGLLEDRLKVPLIIQNDDHLPAFVDEKTLLILSSYSGNTDEVLQVAHEAEKTKAQLFVIAHGGKLKEWAIKKEVPYYGMERLANPGGQPRMAVGHSIMGLIDLLRVLGLVEMEDREIEGAVEKLKSLVERWKKEVKLAKNPTKKLAMSLLGKGVIMISSRHLRGAAYVFKNQLNENAKTFAARFELPELGHHLLEGLTYPLELKGELMFLLFDSALYDEGIRRRVKIVQDIVGQQGHELIKLVPESENRFCQMWEVILFGEFVSFYLAILNGLDPTPIPWVDYLKKRLEK